MSESKTWSKVDAANHDPNQYVPPEVLDAAPHGVLDPPKEPKEIFVTKEERLEAEVLQLRIALTLAYREKRVDAHYNWLRTCDEQLSAMRDKVTKMQGDLSKKYNIDFALMQIEPETGRVIQVTLPQPK